jgi:hypothetical protein
MSSLRDRLAVSHGHGHGQGKVTVTVTDVREARQQSAEDDLF